MYAKTNTSNVEAMIRKGICRFMQILQDSDNLLMQSMYELWVTKFSN